MRVLVCGGAGFIGSAYVRAALSGRLDGVESVLVLDKLTYAGNLSSLAPVAEDPRFRFVRGDITDAGLLRSMRGEYDALVNFAAESHVDRSIADPAAFVTTNVLGAQTVFEAARDAGARVLHVGTDEVYGSIAAGAWTESSPLAPNSPYAASKAAAELLARAYFVTYGLDVCTTRGGNTFGPYQHPEKLIPRFVTSLLTGRRLPLYGDGSNVRNWLHVDDHVRAIHVVLMHGVAGESYNVGGTELTNLALTSRMLQWFGAGADVVERVPDRLGHDQRYSVDDSKIRTLGYEPECDLECGLVECFEWYRANPGWWAPLHLST